MGLHLSLYRVPVGQAEIRDHRFDSDRFSGDEDFWLWLASHAVMRPGLSEFNDPDLLDLFEYLRPRDLNEARAWVLDHIPWEGNQKRLVDLLAWMEADPDLYLFGAW